MAITLGDFLRNQDLLRDRNRMPLTMGENQDPPKTCGHCQYAMFHVPGTSYVWRCGECGNEEIELPEGIDFPNHGTPGTHRA